MIDGNYLKSIGMGEMSEHTLRSYQTILGRFTNFFNLQSPDDLNALTSDNIRSYQEDLLDGGMSESSANSHLRVIKVYINWMLDNDKIVRNPLKGVKRLKEGEKDTAVYFTIEERDAMLNNTSNLNKRLMLALLFFQGLRREEISEVMISDFNSDEGSLVIHGKGNKQVKQENINPYVVNLFKEYLDKRESDSPYLFSSRKMGFGQEKIGWHKITGQSVLNTVRSAARRAGIPESKIKNVGAHTTRRSCACHLALLGFSDLFIQGHMRHASVVTTQQYTKPARQTMAAKASMALPAPVMGVFVKKNHEKKVERSLQPVLEQQQLF